MIADDENRVNPIFVERQTYRRRRLMDAVRALPVLATMLWMVPLLWGLPTDSISAARGLIYIFLVWAGLVCASAALVLAIGRSERREAALDTQTEGEK